MKIDKFILAILLTIILAWLFPQFGSQSNRIPLDAIGNIGIALIFFFYGLKLSPEKLKHGLKNWKLHVLVQTSTFLIFPLFILMFHPLIRNENQEMIWLSFLFLGALPSTVSSSVVMVAIAKGNLPAAIFNASISGLIGIVVTPLWIGLFIENNQQDFHLGMIYRDLLIQILLPVVLGLLLQRCWGNWASKNSRKLSLFDKSIILLIIYKSFAPSFESKIFSSVNVGDLLLITVLAMVLFFVIYGLTGWLADKLKFNKEDKITAQYCGTKKSLVHGTVFSAILFPAHFPMGMILLPLMIFHAFQIFVISIFASKEAERN